MSGRRFTVLLIATLALLAAGCGGDDSNEASSDTDTAVIEETTTAEVTTGETTETTAGGATTALGECAELATLGTKLAQAVTGSNANVEEASKLLDELATKVPEEIRADFQVIAENFSKIAEKLKGLDLSSAGGTPSADDLAKLQELTASLSSPEVTKAGQRIQAWAEKNC
jgi:ABC-type phosphate transport system substrate-binding protein